MAEHEPLRGFLDDQARMQWDEPQAVGAFLRRLGLAGKRVEVLFREEHGGRTKAQSDGFHAMVSRWARDRGIGIESLKQWLLGEVFGMVDFVHPRTGVVVEVLAEPHTSDLTKAQFSHLIEETLRLAAEDGYALTAPDEYRRQQEERQRAAERRQQERQRAERRQQARQDAATAAGATA